MNSKTSLHNTVDSAGATDSTDTGTVRGREDRDLVLGRALAGAIRMSSPGDCPGTEEIAALSEGGLPIESRDRIFGHLAACDHCRNWYQTVMGMKEAEERQAEEIARYRWLKPANYLAVAAVVILAVSLHYVSTQQTGIVGKPAGEMTASSSLSEADRVASAPAPPAQAESARKGAGEGGAQKTPVVPAPMVAAVSGEFSPLQAAKMLADGGRLIPPQEQAIKGFAARQEDDSLRFRIGVTTMRAVVAFNAGDLKTGARLLDELKRQFDLLTGTEAVAEKIAGLQEQLRAEAQPVGDVAKTVAELVRTVPVINRSLINLGSWAEASRIAAQLGNADFFASPQFTQQLAKSRLLSLPAEGTIAINQLGKVAALRKAGPPDFQAIVTQLDTLASFY